MRHEAPLQSGDIVVSRLHPKIGEFVSRDTAKRHETVRMRYLDGTIVQIPLRMIRPATELEIAEYHRRKSEP